ncbi:MAG: magnesium transporter [Thaumarchaeota archaeon S15]|nr:MAG: magnesium transporter [Thaumarchaeota archaeon S13]RNJ75998.1 MAG: magnesium transporter [Thaumarchaeota archaeon S15]
MSRSSIAKRLWSGRRRRPRDDGALDERKVERMDGRGFVWIDLQNPDRENVERLAAEYGFNALNVEDCLTKFELPKLDAYSDHMFLILHFPPIVAKEAIPKHNQLSIFVGRGFLITVHQGNLKPLVDLVRACKGGIDPERRDRLMSSSTAVLLHEIIDVLVDDLLHTLRRVMANLDDIEDDVFDESKSVAKDIHVLRREITVLRRIASPLKRIVLGAAKNIASYSPGEDLTLHFDDVIDHIDKAIDTLEESKETMEIYKDTDFVLSTEKASKVLAVLTIIFTLAIPATVIGTFYGMNVSLPGGSGDSGGGGPHTTFLLVILASVVPAGIMYLYFRRLGWISG